jgi:RHS repeat-associated protein
LGTPQMMTNISGTIVWDAAYEPFGKINSFETQSLTNNFRFPGQYEDSLTGMYYNHHRYYMPELGRFSRDDLVATNDGFNPYSYGANNSINYVDPQGLTVRTNIRFFLDWVNERGEAVRTYGAGQIEWEEVRNSPGADHMRNEFKNGNCRNINGGTFGGHLHAAFHTVSIPGSVAFQMGGFGYDAINNNNGTVTYTIRNRASLRSLLYGIRYIPELPRGGRLHLFGNIDQAFIWTEPIPCCQRR